LIDLSAYLLLYLLLPVSNHDRHLDLHLSLLHPLPTHSMPLPFLLPMALRHLIDTQLPLLVALSSTLISTPLLKTPGPMIPIPPLPQLTTAAVPNPPLTPKKRRSSIV
jgi:hypothetical protein